MLGWIAGLIVGVFGSIIIIIIIILLIRFRRRQRTINTDEHHDHGSARTVVTTETLQSEVGSKRRPRYQLFRRGSSTKTIFNWADHPSLITDAVENGWSQFAFRSYGPSPPSIRSSVFNSVRVTGDYNTSRESNYNNPVEESWVIGSGSVEFMQKLEFKTKGSKASSTVRMNLPLPGPAEVKSFPQEAYFEITVLSTSEDNGKGKGKGGEGEKTKLLRKQSVSSSSLMVTTARGGGGGGGGGKGEEGLYHVSSRRGSHLYHGGRGGGKGGAKMSIGLSVGGFVTSRIPGTYPGSIGFNSDGSVFLGGMKLVFESEKVDEVNTGKVIGCGFDPRKKKVYFTVDSELIHVIHCKSEDFGMPLYPVLATNIDISVLVNLGQSSFDYPPANAHRTPNPCFISPVRNSYVIPLGYEDSKDLFSMERFSTGGLSHSATTRSTISNTSDHYYNIENNKMTEDEEELDVEFFEIVLDHTGT